MIDILHVSSTCRTAYEAEITGQYESGLRELREFWDYAAPDKRPDISGLKETEAGELLLRAGALYGFYVISMPDRQEVSKNLLTDALSIFMFAGDRDKEAECTNYLALAYWRMGNSEEAEAWLSQSFEREQQDNIFLHSLIIESLIKLTDGCNEYVFEKLNRYKFLFESTTNLFLKGTYFMNLGLAKMEIGGFSDTADCFSAAGKMFSRLNNKHYLSLNENNISRHFHREKNYPSALEHASNGIKIAADNCDLRQTGIIFDTQAQIAIDQGDYLLSVLYANKSIETLEQTEAYNYLIESYETKIRALAKLGEYKEAMTCFGTAYRIAFEKTGQKIIDRLTETAAAAFAGRLRLEIKREGGNLPFAEEYEIALPPGMMLTKGVIGFESTTNRMLLFGIAPGDVVVAETGGAKQGELVAITTLDGNHFIGFLLFDRNHVRLSFKDGSDGLHFPRSSVKSAGKVIGCCRITTPGETTLYLEPIKTDIDL